MAMVLKSTLALNNKFSCTNVKPIGEEKKLKLLI